MSAGLLREAAVLMRQRAEAATASPWSAADEHGLWAPATPAWCVNAMQPGWESMSPQEGYIGDVAYPADQTNQADAEHIASWHPAVALAVAAWLDNAADRRQFRGGPRPEFAHAEIIAAAYLGRKS